MRILNFILAAIFLLFAFVQINDPDPILWIVIYGLMAVLSVLAIFKIYPRKIILVMLVVFIGFSLTLVDGVQEWFQQEDKSVLFDDVAKMEHLYIEEAREFLGLCICIAALIFHYIRSRMK